MAWTTHVAGLIGGSTFHNIISIDIAEVPNESILARVRGNSTMYQKLWGAKVIFIDEMPMSPARWLIVFEFVMRQLAVAHRQYLPWGGVQVVGAFSWCYFSRGG